jgi:endonuclease/exonuclease/phosphatase family metal-dependent hydrolase
VGGSTARPGYDERRRRVDSRAPVRYRDPVSRLRIMTYNVRYFSHGTRGLASTARSMKGIAQAIAALDPLPDIVCLQEVETSSLRANLAHPRKNGDETQLGRLMDELHAAIEGAAKTDTYEAYYFPAHAYTLSRKTNIYTTGLAILAHRDYAIHHHNADRPMDITHRRVRLVRGLKQTRISAHVRFDHVCGRSVDIFNTHLSLPASFTADFWLKKDRMGYGRNQLEEAKKLADFIDAERASDRFIVVGDFNALPGSPVHRFLVEERGLRDAFRVTHQGDDESDRRFATAGFLNLRMRLDHVFAGSGISWLDFEDTAPFGKKTSRFHGLSDHVPLIARCRLDERTASVASR